MATCNPSALLESAKCFKCRSKKELQAIIAQLLCNISAMSFGSGQIVVYTTDPNTELLQPTDATLPAVAYSADGTGAMYGWNTTTLKWV